MPLVPLLPLFHALNREHFDSSLTIGLNPKVRIRWSDGRLKKTAGFYRFDSQLCAKSKSEIVLSKPLLEHLPQIATESTLCHEMIHAWVHLSLGIKEAHGPNFRARMSLINASQDRFKVSVRHQFPVPISMPKWWAVCPSCGLRMPYKRLLRGAACRQCCNRYYDGKWDSRCVLNFEPGLQEV